MREQLFTATGEAKGSGQVRMGQLFTGRRGKRTAGRETATGDRDREGEGWGGLCLLSLSFHVYPCHVIGIRTSGVYEQ